MAVSRTDHREDKPPSSAKPDDPHARNDARAGGMGDKMDTYLVTGGCGFIGSHLVDALIADGHSVRVIDDLSTGVRERLPPEVEFLEADVLDAATLARMMAGVCGCFHLAAIASVPACHRAWLEAHRVNLGATVAVLEAAARASAPVPVVYASSAAVYGANQDLPLRESTAPTPLSAYGVDKHGCELHARIAAKVFGVPNAGLRFFNIYGPRQRPDDAYAGVISIFAAHVFRGEEIILHGDGGQERDFVFVSDAVEALRTAMTWARRQERPTAGLFNVCTGRSTTIAALGEAVMRCAGTEVAVRHGPARAGDVRGSRGSPERAAALLGFRTATPLESGLALTLEALRADGAAALHP
jgi:UDP-glucose 4-epimerase